MTRAHATSRARSVLAKACCYAAYWPARRHARARRPRNIFRHWSIQCRPPTTSGPSFFIILAFRDATAIMPWPGYRPRRFADAQMMLLLRWRRAARCRVACRRRWPPYYDTGRH